MIFVYLVIEVSVQDHEVDSAWDSEEKAEKRRIFLTTNSPMLTQYYVSRIKVNDPVGRSNVRD